MNLVDIHNLVRWIMLPVLIFVLVRSFSGWLGKKEYLKIDRITGGILVGLAHLQLLIGLIQYFSGEVGFKLLQSSGMAVMKDKAARFAAIEHPLTMIIAIALIQVGRSLSKKAATDEEKFKKVAIFTGIACLLILSRMPHWEF